MFGTYFYHQRIRKSVAIFGALFNNIYVLRKNSSGDVISQIKVPLAYAPRQKYLDRIRTNPDLDTDSKVALKLPRMSFEIVTINYDGTRQLQKTNNFQQAGTSNSLRNKFNSYVPYTLTFQLNVYAKNQDDALQVVEQIVPYFTPQYTLTVKPFSDFANIKEDVPITLSSVDFTDDFEGPLEQRRTIIYSLTFDMNVNFYGPVSEQGIIRQVDANLYNMNAGLNDSDIPLERIRVIPDPADVSPDSDFGFTTSITLLYDSA